MPSDEVFQKECESLLRAIADKVTLATKFYVVLILGNAGELVATVPLIKEFLATTGNTRTPIHMLVACTMLGMFFPATLLLKMHQESNVLRKLVVSMMLEGKADRKQLGDEANKFFEPFGLEYTFCVISASMFYWGVVQMMIFVGVVKNFW